MHHLTHVPAGSRTCATASGWRNRSNAGCCAAAWSAGARFAICATDAVPQTADRGSGAGSESAASGAAEAGLKLASVMTDVMGVSGRAMVEGLVHGTTDPTVLAELARGRLRSKLPALQQALRGQFRPQHAFLVTQILGKIDFLEEAIATLTEEIDPSSPPFEATVTRLMTIPGLARRNRSPCWSRRAATCTTFRRPRICAVGARCVRARTRARGKRHTGRRGTATATCAGRSSKRASRRRGAAARRSRPLLSGEADRGQKKAVVAVGHQILEIAYYVMRDGVTYQELGADYFERRDRERRRDDTSNNSRPSATHVTLSRHSHREHFLSRSRDKQTIKSPELLISCSIHRGYLDFHFRDP